MRPFSFHAVSGSGKRKILWILSMGYRPGRPASESLRPRARDVRRFKEIEVARD